jgi:GTP pyrophosphokinase
MADGQVSTPFFSERFTEALTYAVRLHNRQARKGSGGRIPYAGHLLGVCSLVIEEGGGETEAIAALLHDAAEDQGGERTLAKIRDRFGAAVADIVLACSDTLETSKPEWQERKEAYLAHLEDRTPSQLMVALADKLFNAHAILRDYKACGEELWGRFRAGRDGQLWYYRRLSDEFTRLLPDSPMAHELAEVVAELEQLVAGDHNRSASGTPREPSRQIDDDQ